MNSGNYKALSATTNLPEAIKDNSVYIAKNNVGPFAVRPDRDPNNWVNIKRYAQALGFNGKKGDFVVFWRKLYVANIDIDNKVWQRPDEDPKIWGLITGPFPTPATRKASPEEIQKASDAIKKQDELYLIEQFKRKTLLASTPKPPVYTAGVQYKAGNIVNYMNNMYYTYYDILGVEESTGLTPNNDKENWVLIRPYIFGMTRPEPDSVWVYNDPDNRFIYNNLVYKAIVKLRFEPGKSYRDLQVIPINPDIPPDLNMESWAPVGLSVPSSLIAGVPPMYVPGSYNTGDLVTFTGKLPPLRGYSKRIETRPYVALNNISGNTTPDMDPTNWRRIDPISYSTSYKPGDYTTDDYASFDWNSGSGYGGRRVGITNKSIPAKYGEAFFPPFDPDNNWTIVTDFTPVRTKDNSAKKASSATAQQASAARDASNKLALSARQASSAIAQKASSATAQQASAARDASDKLALSARQASSATAQQASAARDASAKLALSARQASSATAQKASSAQLPSLAETKASSSTISTELKNLESTSNKQDIAIKNTMSTFASLKTSQAASIASMAKSLSAINTLVGPQSRTTGSALQDAINTNISNLMNTLDTYDKTVVNALNTYSTLNTTLNTTSSATQTSITNINKVIANQPSNIQQKIKSAISAIEGAFATKSSNISSSNGKITNIANVRNTIKTTILTSINTLNKAATSSQQSTVSSKVTTETAAILKALYTQNAAVIMAITAIDAFDSILDTNSGTISSNIVTINNLIGVSKGGYGKRRSFRAKRHIKRRSFRAKRHTRPLKKRSSR